MAEGARLESVYTATYRGFESLPHRHIRNPSRDARVFSFLTYENIRGRVRALDQGSHSGEAAQHRLADGPEGVRNEVTNNLSLTATFETRAEMLGFSRFWALKRWSLLARNDPDSPFNTPDKQKPSLCRVSRISSCRRLALHLLLIVP